MKDEKEEQKIEESVKGEAPQPAQPEETKIAGQLKELQEKLEAAIKEKDELFARLQRVSADYANYQSAPTNKRSKPYVSRGKN